MRKKKYEYISLETRMEVLDNMMKNKRFVKSRLGKQVIKNRIEDMK